MQRTVDCAEWSSPAARTVTWRGHTRLTTDEHVWLDPTLEEPPQVWSLKCVCVCVCVCGRTHTDLLKAGMLQNTLTFLQDSDSTHTYVHTSAVCLLTPLFETTFSISLTQKKHTSSKPWKLITKKCSSLKIGQKWSCLHFKATALKSTLSPHHNFFYLDTKSQTILFLFASFFFDTRTFDF